MSFYPDFTETFFINRHDADFMGYLKPGSLLRYVQQIATDQNTRLGFTNDFYDQNHFVYLLARQAVEFARVPRIDETLTLTTIPEKSRRAVNKRLTIAVDEAGGEVACVDSRWVLVDTDTRRILRHASPLMEPYWNDTVERALEQSFPRAETLTELPPCRADYMNCDLNGHLNNCSYADLACAAMPLDWVREKPIRSLRIVYHREIALGQQLFLAAGPAENGWYTRGTRAGGENAFEAFCAQ